ncbi:hypothetical protein EIP91_004031 [Steccherinum ochraceum]|uniref:Uncharacterized protein n=1 Tax=Steccherinum ochraceum TaxID=92696 RepID=A0A4R0RCT5_9APHY|nr:hypothetical protein EIP91_004031 [Steccherinum ochraceum]
MSFSTLNEEDRASNGPRCSRAAARNSETRTPSPEAGVTTGITEAEREDILCSPVRRDANDAQLVTSLSRDVDRKSCENNAHLAVATPKGLSSTTVIRRSVNAQCSSYDEILLVDDALASSRSSERRNDVHGRAYEDEVQGHMPAMDDALASSKDSLLQHCAVKSEVQSSSDSPSVSSLQAQAAYWRLEYLKMRHQLGDTERALSDAEYELEDARAQLDYAWNLVDELKQTVSEMTAEVKAISGEFGVIAKMRAHQRIRYVFVDGSVSRVADGTSGDSYASPSSESEVLRDEGGSAKILVFSFATFARFLLMFHPYRRIFTHQDFEEIDWPITRCFRCNYTDHGYFASRRYPVEPLPSTSGDEAFKSYDDTIASHGGSLRSAIPSLQSTPFVPNSSLRFSLAVWSQSWGHGCPLLWTRVFADPGTSWNVVGLVLSRCLNLPFDAEFLNDPLDHDWIWDEHVHAADPVLQLQHIQRMRSFKIHAGAFLDDYLENLPDAPAPLLETLSITGTARSEAILRFFGPRAPNVRTLTLGGVELDAMLVGSVSQFTAVTSFEITVDCEVGGTNLQGLCATLRCMPCLSSLKVAF